jgi:hypothetical protein
MKAIQLIIIGLFVLHAPAFCQKESEHREQTWFAYFNQTRLTNKSGIWMDLHFRMTDNFLKEPSISIARLGYTYFLSDQARLTAGYAYVTQYVQDAGPDIPEHRPWQQIQWFEKKSYFTMMQYLRVEERYRRKVEQGELTQDYLFTWRFRYNIAVTIPLKGQSVTARTPFLFINDELHVNAGKNIVNNYFDQNRLFVGLGYQFTTNLNAQVGYLYVFQQLPQGNRYVHIDAIRLFVFHNLDFRKKSE